MNLEITPTKISQLAAAINKIGYKIVFKNGMPDFYIADAKFLVIAPPDENKYGMEEEYCLALDCGDYGLDNDELLEIYDRINDIHTIHLGGVTISIETYEKLCFDISYTHISFVKETPKQMQKILATMIDIMLQMKYELDERIDHYKRYYRKK